MFILSAILFIIIIRNKKIYQHINFLISSFVGLIPLLPYYHFYKNINFLEPEVMWRSLANGGGPLKEKMLYAINGSPFLVGATCILILIFSPYASKYFLKNKKNIISIYIFIIIPVSFLLLPTVIILLFSQFINLPIMWYTPVIPFVIVLCINIYRQIPSILKTFIITIKLSCILLILINNIFLCNINNYFANLYPRSNNKKLCEFRNICHRFFVFPWSIHNINILCYMRDYKDINILITNLFTKLDRISSFMYIYPEGRSRLFNTAIETYAIKRNKKFLHPHIASDKFTPSNIPDTLYIGLIADRSLLSIKDTSNPLLFEKLLWIDENQVNFLKPYLKSSSIYHIIPIDIFEPKKMVVIFKFQLDLKNEHEFYELLNINLPGELNIVFIE